METGKNLTGFPSVDKPWLAKYPEFVFLHRKTYDSIYNKLRAVWADNSEILINYYDTPRG